MAKRVFLHVGTPKSGTTFLQSALWTNKVELREQGLLIPGKGLNQHYWASAVVRGGPQLDLLPPAARTAWSRMLARIDEFDDDALLSHELFSLAEADRAAGALQELAGVADEVHVVLTARDLARQIPAEWQQRTKHGRSQTFLDFIEAIQTDRTMHFWRVQDVPDILARWGDGIPQDRVHLVVLPPPGGPSSFLWDQLCAITGIDGAGMAERARRSNVSLGLVEAETMRRVSGELNRGGLAKSTQRLLKNWFAEQILRTAEPERIVLPAGAHSWAVDEARGMVARLAGRDYQVWGDLDHLVPPPEPTPGRAFEDLAESEVSAAAVSALARFVLHEEAARQQTRGVDSADRPEARRAVGAPQTPRPTLARRLRARLRRRR